MPENAGKRFINQAGKEKAIAMKTAILNIERNNTQWSTERSMTSIDQRQMGTHKLKVAAYARVSSDSADQIDSYMSQVRHYSKIIRENKEWEYVDIYADEGLSGLSADKREDFQRMLDDCRKGKIDRILVKSVSRFARNFMDCVAVIRELHMLGISVYFAKENIDTAKTGDDLMLSLQSLWAQRESISISGNMRRGIRMRMKTGTFLPSSTPFGYKLNTECRTLEIDEASAEVVRRIYNAYLSGQGMQDIAEELNREHVPKRFGKDKWHRPTIFYILTNISYTGDAVWQKKYTTDSLPFKKVTNRGEKTKYYVQNAHPPIVTHEIYAQVQSLIAERREKHAGSVPKEYLLSGKVICGECGRIHRRKITNGKVFWVCRRHDYGKVYCPAPQIPETEMHDALTRMWNKLRYNRRDIIDSMLEQLQVVAERRYQRNDRLSQVNNELSSLSEQAHVLKRLNTKGYMEPALCFDQMRELNEKVKALRILKNSLMEQDQIGIKIAELESLLAALEAGPEWMETIDEELIGEIVDKIIVRSPEQISIRLVCGLEFTENINKAVR